MNQYGELQVLNP